MVEEYDRGRMCKVKTPDLSVLRASSRALHRGVTRWDVVFVIAIVIIILVVFLPIIVRVRAHSHVTVCQAHLRMIGSAHNVAAIKRHGDGTWVQVPTSGPIRYVGLMDYKHVQDGPRNRSVSIEDYIHKTEALPRELTTSRFIWETLFVSSDSLSYPLTTDNFVCPASDDRAAKGEFIAGQWRLPRDLFDFGDWGTCSYGLQVPFGAVARPGVNAPAHMPLLADKGPWSRLAEVSRGLPTEQRLHYPADGKWTQYNSPNHKGRGQNIFFGDGHIQYATSPLGGVDKDNIYSSWQAPTSGLDHDVRTGHPPSLRDSALLPSGPTDTLIYP